MYTILRSPLAPCPPASLWQSGGWTQERKRTSLQGECFGFAPWNPLLVSLDAPSFPAPLLGIRTVWATLGQGESLEAWVTELLGRQQKTGWWKSPVFKMQNSATRIRVSVHARAVCKGRSEAFLCSLRTPRAGLQAWILSRPWQLLTPEAMNAASPRHLASSGLWETGSTNTVVLIQLRTKICSVFHLKNIPIFIKSLYCVYKRALESARPEFNP